MIPRFYLDADDYDAVQLDPDDIEDFTRDWTRYLDGDTISASAWTASGVTVDSSSNTTTSATVTLSGLKRDPAEVTNQITTAAGRKKSWTFRVYEREM